jgi:hypothetical protein
MGADPGRRHIVPDPARSDAIALVARWPPGRGRARRGAALALVWLATFALSASVGFAAVISAAVTMVRASRDTPAVTAARLALGDAVSARDRECKTGTGRYCREREASVVDRRQALDTAMQAVQETADPQTAAGRQDCLMDHRRIGPAERE